MISAETDTARSFPFFLRRSSERRHFIERAKMLSRPMLASAADLQRRWL